MKNVYPTDAVSIAQKLMQFDTTNGIRPERDCILYIKDMLESHGIETKLVSRDESRPNLFAKIRSKHLDPAIPPFVMYGHVDVVSTTGQAWDKDPFGGVIEDGYLWGRGAIDMKGEHGMFLETMIRLAEEGIDLPFDVVYIAVSDEEGTSDYGVKYLVENHPEEFAGMKYAIGEIGGFSLEISGKKLYPIQIGEKQTASIKITAKGSGGHASMKHKNTAMERLADAIAILSKKRLPVRITEPVRVMITAIGDALGGV
ncbi:MAG: M20/M25/M40 family metallo-hydrolase, partial [Firmicutes bacterium]|nr:M20/M25/M40 family metallo-hydrolase [Bacillota bacterium]